MRRVMSCLTLVITVVMLFGFSIGVMEATEYELPPIDPADFDSPQDNIYFPMAPKTTYVYEAETEDGLIRNEITVTTKKYKIKNLGVTCTVIYDVEWEYVEELDAWFLIEETDDWHAWDNDGNVWYFGEATLEYLYDDDWNLIGTRTEGSWEAGVDDAEPGIIMLANSAPGISYRQEYYEDVAEDMGKVLALNAMVSVEYGDFDDCLKIKEWTRLESGAIEHKYYAPDVGLVLVEELTGKTVRVELIDIY